MKKIFMILIGLVVLINPVYVHAEEEEPAVTNNNTAIETPETTTNEERQVDNTLSDIKVEGAKLSPAFNKTTYKYKITNIDPEKFKISYTQSDTATLVAAPELNSSNQLEAILNNNKKTTITVTYTDSNDKQHSNKYEITIDYEAPKKSLYLNSLKVVGYAFDKAFDKTSPIYSFKIPNEVSMITIEAEAEDSSATITYNGSTSNVVKNLIEGEENHIKVTVKIGNDSNTYYLNVIRSLAEEEKEVEVEEETEEEEEKEEELDDNAVQAVTQSTPSINTLFNIIGVTLASLIGLGIGGIGIYFYIKTSPKTMKKEILKYKNDKKESPIVEVDTTTKEYKLENNDKDA